MIFHWPIQYFSLFTLKYMSVNHVLRASSRVQVIEVTSRYYKAMAFLVEMLNETYLLCKRFLSLLLLLESSGPGGLN